VSERSLVAGNKRPPDEQRRVVDEPLFPPDLTPDGIAQALAGDYPAIPHGYASFKGYLAPKQNGVYRFFTDDTFRSWIEVKAEDIVGRINVPANATDPRSMLYIKHDALVIKCHVHRAFEVDDTGADRGEGGLTSHPPWP
jgi:hypothetical protein